MKLEVLSAPQRALWDHELAGLPAHWVLYGGTAIALRTAHRSSIDFDFFSDRTLDPQALRSALPILARATVLHQAPESLDLSMSVQDTPVKLSFFGGLQFGRVSAPERAENGVALAGLLDLLAIKLKVLQQRVEPRDYADIAALLDAGLDLSDGLRAAAALFPNQLNPVDAAKAVAWFRDGDLERKLPAETRRRLREAVEAVDPAALSPLPIAARSLE